MHTISQKLQKQLDDIANALKGELGAIRGSRPTAALVEDITVDCYGQRMAIKQLGTISIVPPREIQISIWDKSIINAVCNAISEKLSVQAAANGTTIHVNLPSLSQERRDEIIKLVKSKVEDTRIRSRTTRDELKKELAEEQKSGSITEDEHFKIGEDMQKSIDGFNASVDALLEKKIVEINE